MTTHSTVKKPLKRIGYLIIGVWFIACSALITWYSTSNKNEFDPKMQLSQAIMDLSFEQTFSQLLITVKPELTDNARVIHFTQGDCYCEWLAEPHQNKLDEWASKHEFDAIYIDLKDFPQLQAYIPSTPAIAAIDDNNQLIYLGPYSRGSGCFSQSGEVDIQLNNYLIMKETNKLGINALIDTDASGCYCNT